VERIAELSASTRLKENDQSMSEVKWTAERHAQCVTQYGIILAGDPPSLDRAMAGLLAKSEWFNRFSEGLICEIERLQGIHGRIEHYLVDHDAGPEVLDPAADLDVRLTTLLDALTLVVVSAGRRIDQLVATPKSGSSQSDTPPAQGQCPCHEPHAGSDAACDECRAELSG
jgi:hypothetical protein